MKLNYVFLVVSFIVLSGCDNAKTPKETASDGVDRVLSYDYFVKLTDSIKLPIDQSLLRYSPGGGPGFYDFDLYVDSARAGVDRRYKIIAKVVGDPDSPVAIFYYSAGMSRGLLVTLPGRSLGDMKTTKEDYRQDLPCLKVGDRVFEYVHQRK